MTQVFQLEDDSARGDRTLSVALGPSRALRFGELCLLEAGAVTILLVARQFGWENAVLPALAYAAIISHQERFARAIEANALDDVDLYRRAMHSYYMAAAGFLLFISYRAFSSS